MIVVPEMIRSALAEMLHRASGQRLNIAQVGVQLRRTLPDFHPSQVGASSLRAVLEACPDVGTLVETGPGNLVFCLQTTQLRLKADWFAAITRFEDAQFCWLDLASQQLVYDEGLVAESPERYLEVPRFPRTKQRDLAAMWIATQHDEHRAQLRSALDAASDLRDFLEVARTLGLSAAWSTARTDAVVQETLSWARDHGIEPRVVLQATRRNPSSDTPDRRSNDPRQQEHDEGVDATFRAFLHGAIDRMTLAELDQLWIPARLLRER